MQLPNLLEKIKNVQKSISSRISNQTGEHSAGEVPKVTKLKVVAALVIVGFATYVAYWVQTPIDNNSLRAQDLEAEVPAESAPIEVSIEDFTFSPANLTVEKNASVIWTNKDAVSHTVSGDDFSSGPLETGESFTYIFEQDGTFDYNCSFHPQMKGKVVVGTGLSIAEEAILEADLGEGPTDAASEPGDTVFEDLFPAPADEVGITPNFLAVNTVSAFGEEGGEVLAEAAPSEPEAVVLDMEELLADDALGAAIEEQELSDTGPEVFLYFGIFGAVLYYNRKRLLASAK